MLPASGEAQRPLLAFVFVAGLDMASSFLKEAYVYIFLAMLVAYTWYLFKVRQRWCSNHRMNYRLNSSSALFIVHLMRVLFSVHVVRCSEQVFLSSQNLINI